MSAIPAGIATAADYAAAARAQLDPATWAWLDAGAGDGLSRHRNESAFDALPLRPRVLADLAGAHTRQTLFGHEYAHPIFLAPVATHRYVHADGELATMRGAAAMQAGVVVSTQASQPLADIAAAAGGSPWWFQLYAQATRDATAVLVDRAEAAGARALVLTVDAPLAATRPQELRSGFVPPAGLGPANLHDLPPPPAYAALPGGPGPLASPLLAIAPRWDDIAWLKSRTRLPLLLKGVLDAADARRAVDCGIDGLIVSNHGGRCLDGVPATIDVLPEIAAAVAGRVPLLLDGGIRRGSDVLKAIALGARAVLVGRPQLHALAVAGAPGVAHLLHLLRTELETAMALCGRATLADVGPDLVRAPRHG